MDTAMVYNQEAVHGDISKTKFAVSVYAVILGPLGCGKAGFELSVTHDCNIT